MHVLEFPISCLINDQLNFDTKSMVKTPVRSRILQLLG